MIDSDARYDVQAAFCHNGSVAACFMGSVFELYAVDAASEQPRFGGIRESIGPYIHDNRCRIAKHFLEHTDKQWLWMIDNDMEFEPDTLRKLLDAAEEHDVKLIGAAYWNQYARNQCYLSWLLFVQGHGIRAAWHTLEELGEEPIEVTALGMGCTLIHRDVLQAVSEMYPDDPWSTFGADCLVQLEDGGFLVARIPDEWQEALGGREVKQIDRMGEDVTFCLRARRAGFPAYGLPTVTAEHYKAHFMSHGSTSAAQSNGSSSSAGALPSAVASETPTGS